METNKVRIHVPAFTIVVEVEKDEDQMKRLLPEDSSALLADFVNNELIITGDRTVATRRSAIYRRYESWAVARGKPIVSRQKLYRYLESLPGVFKARDKTQTRAFSGLAWAEIP